MCLYIDDKATARINKLFDENGGKLVMFKALWIKKRWGTASLRSPYRWRCKEYTPGWIKSDRIEKALTNGEKRTLRDDSTYNVIEKGIHVYCTEEGAAHHLTKFSNDIVIPVTVYRKDFIAAGIHGDAVFMKVFMKKADHDKAMKVFLDKKDFHTALR
jgi:hypothetical protein